jgi:hypothetical protein
LKQVGKGSLVYLRRRVAGEFRVSADELNRWAIAFDDITPRPSSNQRAGSCRRPPGHTVARSTLYMPSVRWLAGSDGKPRHFHGGAVTATDDSEQTGRDDPLITLVEVDIAVSVPDGMRTRTELLIQALAMASSTALREAGGRPVAVTVRVTDDILAANAAARAALGLTVEQNPTVERVGGVVAGKSLVLEGRAFVLVVSDLAAHAANLDQLRLLDTLAHEFGHVVYGTLRDAFVLPAEDTGIPWEIAAVSSLIAAEEYRVDQIGSILAGAVASALFTGVDGAPLELASVDVDRDRVEVFHAELDLVDPGLPVAVMQRRAGTLDLRSMWNTVASTSHGIAVLAAHAAAEIETHSTGQDLLGGDHPGLEIVGDVLGPLLEYMATSPTIPESWTADLQQICDLGVTGWMGAWALLGLHPGPDPAGGDRWYLHVTAPGSEPPGGPWAPPRYEITARTGSGS